MLVQVQRLRLARAQEVGDVLHLDEGHGRLLELDTGRGDSEVDESSGDTVSESRENWVGSDTHLHRATPSLRPSRRSEDGSLSPSVSSIQARVSFAAAGLYLSRRILRRSLSSDDTDAMMRDSVARGCVLPGMSHSGSEVECDPQSRQYWGGRLMRGGSDVCSLTLCLAHSRLKLLGRLMVNFRKVCRSRSQ